MFTRMKNRLAAMAYTSDLNEVERLKHKNIEEFIAYHSRSMSAELARSIIEGLGGWEMFKKISRTVNANVNPLGAVQHYMSDEQSVTLMRDNKDELYPFALDQLYINTSYPAHAKTDPNLAPISLRFVMNAFRHGVEDNDSQGALLASIVLFAATQDLCRRLNCQSATGVDMMMMEVVTGKSKARHVITALGGYDKLRGLAFEISKSKKAQEAELIEQQLNKGNVLEAFNFGKESLEHDAKSLLSIDVTCAGKYKPIIDPNVCITVHTLLNVIGASYNYITRPSAELETATAKLLIHMATEILCRELTVYEIVH